MGACLAAIKVTGVTTLGIYAGFTVTNALSNYEIFKYVIENSTIQNIRKINSLIGDKLKLNGIVLSVLGSISSVAFQLAYFGAPPRYQHPYLIYSSLVFPVSTLIYGVISRKNLVKFFNLDWFLANSKPRKEDNKAKKEPIRSELDNSVYKDLGDSSSVDEHGEDEDVEIEAEVDFHLSKQVAHDTLDSVHFANRIVSVLSLVGFVIASVGIHGDY